MGSTPSTDSPGGSRWPGWRIDVLSGPAHTAVRDALAAAGAPPVPPVPPGERALLLTFVPVSQGGDPAVALLRALRDLGLGGPHASAGPPRQGLSGREVEIMEHLAGGLTNSEIAGALFISPKTVKNHLSNIYAKLGAHTRSAAVAAWLGTRPPRPLAARPQVPRAAA